MQLRSVAVRGRNRKEIGRCGVLVTGGAGFIGSHLVEGLVERGYYVSVLDDLSTGKLENLGSCMGKIRFVRGDIRDRSVVEDSMRQVDSVFHLAAIASVPYSVEHPEATYEVNVDGTTNILEAILQRGVEKLVYVSTSAVYGDPEYLPVDENHPLSPISPYGESKLKAERLCEEYMESYGRKVTILRPFNAYGPRQRADHYAGVITRFIEGLRKGKAPVIYGDGLQTRDFIYVEDAVRALILASRKDGAAGRIYNVATGVPVSVNNLACLLIDLFEIEGIEPQHVDARPGDIRHSYADVREAKVHLGFEPRISLKEGLSTLLERNKHA